MKVAVLGTGMVGRAHAERLVELGHDVVIGTGDVEKTLSRTEPDAMGNPSFKVWHQENQAVKLLTFSEAASFGELVLEALKGESALSVVSGVAKEVSGKVLIDIANPLDFSKGMPPILSISNTDSLGEQIQAALPDTHVVKTFNTMTAPVQVNPASVAGGDHHIFLSGNDQSAKDTVKKLLQEYGWKQIIDLGDISTARGTEMMMPMWLRLWGTLQTPMFNYKIMMD